MDDRQNKSGTSKPVTGKTSTALFIQENLPSTCSSNPALQTDKHV